MYNIASILLGIAAMVFAVHSWQVRGCLICCTLSGATCGLSLLCQLLELYRLVRMDDVSALLDTVHARVIAGAVLLVAVVVTNVLTLLQERSCQSC